MVNYLDNSNIFANFGAWIGRSCKPSDKGKLTALPHFNFCQHNFKNVSIMLKYEELPEVNSERWLSLENLEGEEWKPVIGIKGLDGYLEISCYGRLKGVAYIGWHPISKEVRHKERMYRLMKTEYGYWQKSIEINGHFHNLLIHRLVASAFLDNSKNLPYVNHMDENPKNNCVYNLEWCTQKHNVNWGTALKRRVETMKQNGITRAVVRYDYEGNVLEEFESESEAERKYNCRGLVSLCCLGKISSAKGMHFRFKGEQYKKRKIGKKKYTFILYEKGSQYIETDMGKFAQKLGVSRSFISYIVNRQISESFKLRGKDILIIDRDGNEFRIKNGIITKKI